MAGLDEIMIDSGAARTIFKIGDFRAELKEEANARTLANISGGTIPQWGKQTPTVQLASGRTGKITGTCATTTKSALSVSSSCDEGNTVVFSNSGSYITREPPPRPTDAEEIIRRGNLFVLPIQEVNREAEAIIAPIQEGGAGSSSGNDEAGAAARAAAAMQVTHLEFRQGYGWHLEFRPGSNGD